MEAGNWMLLALQAVDIVANAALMQKFNKLQDSTGFYLDLMEGVPITDLEKFGEIMGVGTEISVDGVIFMLNGDGEWVDKDGRVLYQDNDGIRIGLPMV